MRAAKEVELERYGSTIVGWPKIADSDKQVLRVVLDNPFIAEFVFTDAQPVRGS